MRKKSNKEFPGWVRLLPRYISNELINEKFLRGSRGRFFQKEPPGRRRQKKGGINVIGFTG
jgi:hypothetical protein